jgi:hypothetical protein
MEGVLLIDSDFHYIFITKQNRWQYSLVNGGFRVWIYTHRQRKEWDAKEKEMVASSWSVWLDGRTRPISWAWVLGINRTENGLSAGTFRK